MKSKNAVLSLLVVFTALVFSSVGLGQYARRIVPQAALPATCNPLNGDVVFLTAGAGAGPYYCAALNTWVAFGTVVAPTQWTLNQGVLIASTPYLVHTATWNNAGVTFVNQNSNITDTASNAASLLFNYQVNGVNVFSGTKLGQLIIAQPSLTASTPFLNHTVTWNNAGVTFVDDFSNVTDTASAAGSLIMRRQVGGVDVFKITKTGRVTLAEGLYAGGGGFLGFTGSSFMTATVDGNFNLVDSTGTTFGNLLLGPSTAPFPEIKVSPAVAGKTQGIIIYGADGIAPVFANLGGATNGSIIYCSDCTIASPCAGGGTGAIAKRLNGVWVCN